MCGLSGEIRFDGRSADVTACGRVTEAMAHRGPDGSGMWARGPVALGHRRLSIIDLSAAGGQPMVDSALGLTVAFNGCIYNYKDLRAELEGLGHRFFSTSDTEVIGKAYAQWGTSCVDHFLGMFAFAVAEHASGRLVLARDRLGIKPLYLDETPQRLRFASSLPALVAGGGTDTSIDPVALACYLTFHSIVPPPRTILNGVTKLPPATIRVVEPDGASTEHTYWSPAFSRDPEQASWSGRDWEEALLDRLRVAVDRRMVADVPVGVLLSGGIDSSPGRGPARRGRAARPHDVQHRLREQRGRARRRVRVLLARRPARSAPTTTGSPSTTRGCCPASTPRSTAMSEPMVSHDCVAFFLLVEDVSKQRQGRPVRAGRRRGAGRLRLVPAAGRRAARGRRRGVRGGVLRPALVGHARPRLPPSG